MNILTRASFQPKLSPAAEQISTVAQTSRRGGRDGDGDSDEGASDKCERREGMTVASYCAARGADGYTPTRVP